MDSADTRTGEHGDGRFGNHRHVDDDAITFFDATLLEDMRECLNLVQQFLIGDCPLLAGDGAVMNDRSLPLAPALDMAVDAIVTGIAGGTGKPGAIDAMGWVEDLFCRRKPVN